MGYLMELSVNLQKTKKENFDMCDAYACVLGYMKQNEIW